MASTLPVLTANKRPRLEEVQKENVDDRLETLVVKFVKVDQNELVRAATNAGLLSNLYETCSGVCASIDVLTKAQEKEEEEKKIAKIAEEQAEKFKQRNDMMRKKLCFNCKSPSDNLTPCFGFKEHRVSGDGVMACEKCRDDLAESSCANCAAFLCKDRHKDLHRRCGCDDNYKCEACGEQFCLPCAEKLDMGETCECDNWYCEECKDGSIKNERCSMCNEKTNTFCDNCEDNSLPKCEGPCREPLCDNCVHVFRCGNDARVCGNCDYECVDCDICAGYWDRW